MKHVRWMFPLSLSLCACITVQDAADDENQTSSSSSVTGGAGGSNTGSSQSGTGGSQLPVEDAAEDVMVMLKGRFDSSIQSQQQSAYFDVQLLACPVHAPELGERVLYVEQALRNNASQPYRQRLYVITAGSDPAHAATSWVYSLVTPAAFVGLCAEPSVRTVTAGEAIERKGCQVELTRNESGFEGGTVGATCSSTLQGASYATSKVWLYTDRIDSWDQGFNSNGQQVWGAEAGPYRFDRKTP